MFEAGTVRGGGERGVEGVFEEGGGGGGKEWGREGDDVL